MMDVNEAREAILEEMDDDYRYDTFIATLIMWEFPRCNKVDRYNWRFEVEGVEYRYEVDHIDGVQDGGVVLIKTLGMNRVIWAFTYTDMGGVI